MKPPCPDCQLPGTVSLHTKECPHHDAEICVGCRTGHEKPELVFVESEDLVEELLHRFDHAAFLGYRILVERERDHDFETIQRFRGNRFMVRGLVEELGQMVHEEIRENMESQRGRESHEGE